MLLETLSSQAKLFLNKVAVVVILAISLNPANAFAWGFEGHKIINERAVQFLPFDLRPFFQNNFRFIREHSIDPDLWRETGTDFDFNHFFNLDYFGGYPFEAVPLDEQEFKKRFGVEAIQHGRVQWQILDVYRT